ncbi:MAG TPA: NAD(P)-binding domain-containing protein, partial [Anseongella sp.]|nr:NAD(P)-binding domain-containing protein [Anseongella sp.]
PDARILIIGAGQTNKLFSKYLRKHGSTNFTVFNRTFKKAEELAAELGGRALPLEQLPVFREGFDVIITCTGAAQPIITKDIYNNLLAGDTSEKIIVDLALPHDTSEELRNTPGIHFIGMEHLQDIVRLNMNERYLELEAAGAIIDRNVEEFKPVLRQRRIELAMREVPHMIKEIRASALNNVFVNDIQQLDPNSREVLEKVLNYMEKRYVSVPMVMAKDILLSQSNN